MDASITLGTGAIANGSVLLDGLLATLYYADSMTVDTESQTAVAQTQEEDGFDGKVTFSGNFSDSSTGTITGLTLALNGVEDLSATGLSFDLGAMKTAIETADGDDPGPKPLVDLFQGVNWTLDASAAQNAVLAYGTGGDDKFTLTDFDDVLEREGGDDIVDMGKGSDTVLFGNSFGFKADHKGHAFVDGGDGSDTLAFFLVNNPFFGDGSFVPVATDVGIIFDLQAGTVNLKGSNDYEFNRYVNFENVNGSEKADRILGSKVANLLDGYLGNDEITGRGGKDILTGGVGNDDFNFVKPGDSPVGKGRDVITDFEHTLDDIDLSKLHPNTDTDKFTFIGQNKLKHVGDLHFVLHDEKGTAHDFTLVEANLKGDATPEIQIQLTGLVHLDKGDFML
jgi:Ca2+-binding RTX toxin-like protein